MSAVTLQGNTQERMVSHIQKAFSIVLVFVRDNSVNSESALAVLILYYISSIPIYLQIDDSFMLMKPIAKKLL